MNFKKLLIGSLVILSLCMALFAGCRKEDGEIPHETGSTKTPVESVESMIPDGVKKMIP